jgi:hypothetical protein
MIEEMVDKLQEVKGYCLSRQEVHEMTGRSQDGVGKIRSLMTKAESDRVRCFVIAFVVP